MHYENLGQSLRVSAAEGGQYTLQDSRWQEKIREIYEKETKEKKGSIFLSQLLDMNSCKVERKKQLFIN